MTVDSGPEEWSGTPPDILLFSLLYIVYILKSAWEVDFLLRRQLAKESPPIGLWNSLMLFVLLKSVLTVEYSHASWEAYSVFYWQGDLDPCKSMVWFLVGRWSCQYSPDLHQYTDSRTSPFNQWSQFRVCKNSSYWFH